MMCTQRIQIPKWDRLSKPKTYFIILNENPSFQNQCPDTPIDIDDPYLTASESPLPKNLQNFIKIRKIKKIFINRKDLDSLINDKTEIPTKIINKINEDYSDRFDVLDWAGLLKIDVPSFRSDPEGFERVYEKYKIF